MPIGRRLRRAIALLMLVALGFAHASTALAACEADRGNLSHASEAREDCPCVEAMQFSPRCLAHCTADLQLAGAATVIARAPSDTPVLLVAPSEPRFASREWQEARPAGGLPARILFQSFLI
jgi:hypothetical protein